MLEWGCCGTLSGWRHPLAFLPPPRLCVAGNPPPQNNRILELCPLVNLAPVLSLLKYWYYHVPAYILPCSNTQWFIYFFTQLGVRRIQAENSSLLVSLVNSAVIKETLFMCNVSKGHNQERRREIPGFKKDEIAYWAGFLGKCPGHSNSELAQSRWNCLGESGELQSQTLAWSLTAPSPGLPSSKKKLQILIIYCIVYCCLYPCLL